ncbi:hypothetical protein N643_07515 [Salmonella bongori serovar 48:z41:-- str. RKS3044]|nr:hypothetical protein N643_07515 [Salmonella bongori serovar 48:z41:-- str. RKS3044]
MLHYPGVCGKVMKDCYVITNSITLYKRGEEKMRQRKGAAQ